METTAVLASLSALAHETRLAAFRRLVQRGPAGMAAGAIAEALDVPAPTLSFHLAALERAGLVASRREGRSVVYAADYATMEALLAYLTENWCADGACAPTSALVAPPRAKKATR